MTPLRGRHTTMWTLILTSAALFIVTLDNLVVTRPPCRSIRRDLDASIQQLEWTVNAYTLTFAVLLLTGAALGDRFGRRRMFVIGIVVFTVGSAVAALAPIDRLADRGAGLPGRRRRDRDAPLTLTILSAAVPAERRGAGARDLGRDRRPRRRDRAPSSAAQSSRA